MQSYKVKAVDNDSEDEVVRIEADLRKLYYPETFSEKGQEGKNLMVTYKRSPIVIQE